MNPHGSDDFISDNIAADDWAAKNDRLRDHLTGPWRLDVTVPWKIGALRRYDGEVVDGSVYTGWALWKRGNAKEPATQS